jgi:acetyltransferase-like isoleucine patch superfamily enzyme
VIATRLARAEAKLATRHGRPGARHAESIRPATIRFVFLWRQVVREFANTIVHKVRGTYDIRALQRMGLTVGKDVFIANGAWLDPLFPWLISIGDGVTMGPDVLILAHDSAPNRRIDGTKLSRVEIGARAYIGARSVILPGVRIGADAIVGAGSVVRRDVPPSIIVAGNPAEPIGSLEDFVAKHRELAMRDSAALFPSTGWTIDTGITAERKAFMRDCLGDGVGYIGSRSPEVRSSGNGSTVASADQPSV